MEKSKREFFWREDIPLLGSGGFLPPNYLPSPAPLMAAALRTCFVLYCKKFIKILPCE